MMDSCVYHFNVAAGSDGWITCLFVKVSNITRNEFQIVSTLQETLHWTFEVSDCPGMDRVLGPGPPHHCKHCIILNTITVLTERAEVLEWLDLCSSFPAYWRSNRFHTHIHTLMAEDPMQAADWSSGEHLGLSIVIKDTSTCSWGSQGFKPATF